MYAFPTRLRPPASRARKDDPMLAADPAAAVVDPAAVAVVENVVAVDPVKKRYRAVVTRNVLETAIVEFDAYEDENLSTLAESLLPSIPPESWTETPDAGWGYIDRIEEVAAADPAALPAETLARQRRSRFLRKGMFDIVYDGASVGTFEAATADDALLAYVNSLGYASIDEAALALGLTVEDFYASYWPQEVATDAAPATLSGKGTFDITATDGTYYGSFEAPTADEAVAAYVLSLGYATTEEAALALGFATADEFIASLTVTEVPAADPAAAPEVMSFKTAGDVTAAVEQIGADAEATLAAIDMADATAVATAIDYLISLRDQLDVSLATGLTDEPDAALAQEAMDAANELWAWLNDQIDLLQGDVAADPALAA